MKSIRKAAIAWLKDNGQLRSDYENIDTGMDEIVVSAKNVNNSFSHNAGPEKIQVAAALPDMIRYGIHVKTQPGKEHQPDMVEHVFVAKVNIGKKPMAVGYIIKEDGNGRRFYDHELTEIMNLDELPSQDGTSQNSQDVIRTRRDSILNIVRKNLKVNSKNKKTENKYYAMKLGPVAETTYDILKKSQYHVKHAEADLLSACRRRLRNGFKPLSFP